VRRALLGLVAICQRSTLALIRLPASLALIAAYPVVYLLVAGNAIMGELRGVPVAVVDEARNALSAECARAVDALARGRRMIEVVPIGSRLAAERALREGRVSGVWYLPEGLGRDGESPALLVDNTDLVTSRALYAAFDGLWAELSAGRIPTPVHIEAFPHLDYLGFLAPAIAGLAIYGAAIVGGGFMVVEDRERGVHEGYFVTPVPTWAIVAGMVLSGTSVAVLAAAIVLGCSYALGLLPAPSPPALLAALLTILLTSLAVMSLFSLIMSRARSSMAMRGIVGILNISLFFPSGAFYPIHSYPEWLQLVARINPLTYGTEALRKVLLRGVPTHAVLPEWTFLVTFALVALISTFAVFKREV
jgi:ABC-2 type transport system permease protein